MNDEDRRDGESELDHSDRVAEARDKQSAEQKKRELAEYNAAATVILTRLAELVAEILGDVVGPTTIKPWRRARLDVCRVQGQQ
ncbi:MAG: hypothetical protein WA215_11430 [Candidatus Cybelea sp.]